MNNNVSNLVVDNQNLIYSISHYFKGYQNKDDLFQVANALGINQVQVSRKEKKILEKLRNQLNE